MEEHRYGSDILTRNFLNKAMGKSIDLILGPTQSQTEPRIDSRDFASCHWDTLSCTINHGLHP
jgi:hypothetical protein